jgi:hypothetical protein
LFKHHGAFGERALPRHRCPPSSARQTGAVSLLTLAILLLLLGGTLMLGLNYFRADLPSTTASREREALLWADKAIIGFASTYHRLPCPAAMPNDVEDCTRAKGWLPGALNLEVSAFEPGHLPMRYMVYRDDSPLTGESETHRAPSIGEAGKTSAGRLLPYDAFEPGGWDNDATSDPTAIVDKNFAQAGAAHEGRFTDRFDFNARNGLDLCETLRLVGVKLAGGHSASFAHYQRAGTPVNVAYGLALPGRFDASGDNERFDGANATDAPEMEAPDRGHDSNYDDTVFVRDLDSLMSAFGCQPVAYTVQAQYEDFIAQGSVDKEDVYDFLKEQGEELPDTAGADGVLRVDFHRQGVAVLMNESVQSLAFAHDVVTEVQDQYDGLQADAKQTMIMASLQSTLSGLGAGVAGLSIAADGIAIAEATAAAAACLGLCANEYVAIGLYTAAIVASSVALALNIAATGIQIAATVNASKIYGRMGGDLDDEAVQDAQDQACAAIAQADAANLEAYLGELARAKDAMDAAETAMNDAEADLDAYTLLLDTSANTCLQALRSTDNSTPGPLQCKAVTNGDCSVLCPAATYQTCFPSSFSSLKTSYEQFEETPKPIETLYQERYELLVELTEREKEMNKAAQEADATDTSEPAVQASIANTAASICQSPNAAADCVDKNILRLTADYDARHTDAVAKRDAAATQVTQTQTSLTAKEAEIAAAAAPVANTSVPDVTCPGNAEVTILCADHYEDSCSDAREYVTRKTWKHLGYGDSAGCQSALTDPANCDRPAYNFLYDRYHLAERGYQEAKARFDEIDAKEEPQPTFGEGEECTLIGDVDGLVEIWPPDDAKEVLRRVDKRSVLQ